MKHAYLIMAHNNFNILEKLLILLDNEKNDIYIHIDKKTTGFDFTKFKDLVNKSNIYFTKQIDTRWGDYSLVQAEVILLEAATKKNYDYYHLISGVDFPLKTQEEIHKIFEENKGREFIHFCTDEELEGRKERVERYYCMKWRRNNSIGGKIMDRILNRYGLSFQRALNIKRSKDENIKCGSQWFSITDSFAKQVVSNKEWIEKTFKNTNCSDEHFLQTLFCKLNLENTLYTKTLGDYKASLRCIDWKRGTPYVFKKEDYKELINSGMIFARKFDEREDFAIIDKLYDFLKKN